MLLGGGKSDLFARIPEVSILNERTIGIVGLGGLGAPSALELARCGTGKLRLMDFDYVDPGITVRWPLGLTYTGFYKATALDDFIGLNYSYTATQSFIHRVGGVRDQPEMQSDLEIMDKFIDGLDLLIDATAEVGVQYLLSEIARERGIPYISIATKQGPGAELSFEFAQTKPKGAGYVRNVHWTTDKSLPLPLLLLS